jgi:hypothetical protein
MRPTPGPFVRAWSIVFVVGLVAIAVGLVVAAVRASGEDRGAFTGLAVLWVAWAAAAVALLVAIERKRRSGP